MLARGIPNKPAKDIETKECFKPRSKALVNKV